MNKYEPLKTHPKVAIVGARGYAGLELVRLLQKHPSKPQLTCVSTSATFTLENYLPNCESQNIPVLSIDKLEALAPELDTLFLATPPEVSLELAPTLLNRGVNVIDLSGAFRLNCGDEETIQAEYSHYYGFKHPNTALLKSAHYGLAPWNAAKPMAREAVLVANPGCYATSVLMALIPLLKRELIESDSIVIDAKSGTTGAGRKASPRLNRNADLIKLGNTSTTRKSKVIWKPFLENRWILALPPTYFLSAEASSQVSMRTSKRV
jgi:N-acetyl-gamma-glutamyl-phosphate reductase